MEVFPTMCLLLLIIMSAPPVSCRRHQEPSKDMILFVFGDSFADVGNNHQPTTTSQRTLVSRAWFFPYGISDSIHGRRATGRVSDGLVQSDFLAKILGWNESPLPYRLQTGDGGRIDWSGVNFASSGSGALDMEGTTSLRRQVDELTALVINQIFDETSLENSVALLAISAGHDYYHVSRETSNNEMRALSEQVAGEIAASVKRLQDLGVGKVLVNLMPPNGCNPWQSVASNYSRCEGHGNTLSSIHNAAVREKLDGDQNVLLLDLYAIFMRLELGKLAPCCLNLDINGYCGEMDGNGIQKYSLCDNPEDFFFWDYIHPTQSAWEGIMERLVGPIEDFLGIQSSW